MRYQQMQHSKHRGTQDCPFCHGTGKVDSYDRKTGKVTKVRCGNCGGTGQVDR